jgi:hypothetical protein
VNLRSWLDRSRFEVVFDLSSRQLSKIDLRKIDERMLDSDMIVAYNPFRDMGKDEVVRALEFMSFAKLGFTAAIPTADFGDVPQKFVSTSRQWVKILSQIGKVVEIHTCRQYEIFLVLK